VITTDKFAFIHMHKTGGQSIIQIIEQCVPSFRNIGYHYPRHLLPPEYSDLPIVGMVRNPWDWYISWYAYNILLNGENPLFFVLSDGCQADYRNTLINLINLGSDTARSQHYRNALIETLPESLDDTNRGSGLTKNCMRNFNDDDCGYYSWLFKRMHGDPDSKTTYIGRFENLRDEFLSIMAQLSVDETQAIREKFNGSARLNESSHSHYSRYYDDDLRGLIAQKDAFLIDKYGYEFEQATDSEKVIEFPSVQINRIQDNFQKLSGEDNNFLLLRSDIDVGPIKKKLAQVPEDAWGQSDREHRFEIHHHTQALLLIYDDDFRHYNPTYLDICSQFEDELKPLLDFIAENYQHNGFVVRLIFAKLQAHGIIPRHADREYSLLKCHRIHVPIISNDDVFFTVGGEQKVMRPGEMWEINNATFHAVDNQSDEDRIHMIIDWVPNATVRPEDRNPVQEQYVSNLTQDQVNGVINLYLAGQMTQAERACRELLKTDPQSAIVLNVLGAALQKLGQLAEAVKSFEKAMQIKPDYAEAYYNYGTALQELAKPAEAVKSFETAIQIKPDFAIAYENRGSALRNLGQQEAAVKSYDKAIEIQPDFAIAYDNRGNALQDLGRLKDAMKSYDMAIQIKPDFPNAYSHRGTALQDLGQWEAAVKSYDMAIQIKPDYAEAYYNRGIALQALGQLQEAMKSYEKAIQIRPDYVRAYSNLGNAHQDVGQLEEAMKSYSKALQIKPDFAEAYHHLSMQKEFKPDDAQIGIMESLYADSDRSEIDHKHLCFALANVYDDLGEYDKSFACLAEGNRLRKKELNYSIDDDRKLMTRIKGAFPAGNVVLEVAPDSMASIQPLFIVGMLRSGTTLVEQILACHSQVHGAGELVTMEELASPILSILSDQNKLSQNDIKRVHDGYLEKLTALKVPEIIITDKTPHNFLWIGFIVSAFPGAKIIHLNRDPKAICWSIYKRYFSTKGHGYANDLVDLAEFYKLYIDLMSFWRERFPNAIYDLCYEDLTESQEEETRKLLAFCDLQWEKQCLDFHENTRVVQTMSAAQVRKKMYQGSSEAWKKYAAHLQPLVDGLG